MIMLDQVDYIALWYTRDLLKNAQYVVACILKQFLIRYISPNVLDDSTTTYDDMLYRYVRLRSKCRGANLRLRAIIGV